MDYRSRLVNLIAELHDHPLVELTRAVLGPGASDEELAQAERNARGGLPAAMRDFYRAVGSVSIAWTLRDQQLAAEFAHHGRVAGAISMLPLSSVFPDPFALEQRTREGVSRAGPRSVRTFDTLLGDGGVLALHPLPGPDPQVVFRDSSSEYHPTGDGFATHLEQMLAARGCCGWYGGGCRDFELRNRAERTSELVERLFGRPLCWSDERLESFVLPESGDFARLYGIDEAPEAPSSPATPDEPWFARAVFAALASGREAAAEALVGRWADTHGAFSAGRALAHGLTSSTGEALAAPLRRRWLRLALDRLADSAPELYSESGRLRHGSGCREEVDAAWALERLAARDATDAVTLDAEWMGDEPLPADTSLVVRQRRPVALDHAQLFEVVNTGTRASPPLAVRIFRFERDGSFAGAMSFESAAIDPGEAKQAEVGGCLQSRPALIMIRPVAPP